jgi:hypothetical protein
MKGETMRTVGVLLGLCLLAGCTTTGTGAGAPGDSKGLLRHVVLFKFKDGTTPAQVKQVEDAFRALPGKVPEIAAFEWGTDNSPEKLAQGFTHCFFVSFRDAKGREAYLPHPAHKAFVEILKPHLDKVLVIDYDARP